MRFNRGDLVHIAADLGPHMPHFTSDVDAIIIGSYADQFGGNDHDSLTVYIKGQGETSWYCSHQLTLLKPNRLDLLDQWKSEDETERVQKSDLDWIFSHGAEVLESAHGASVQALADCFGLSNLWGNHREGFVYYTNVMKTLTLAEPFLRSGDKKGWLEFCAKFILETSGRAVRGPGSETG